MVILQSYLKRNHFKVYLKIIAFALINLPIEISVNFLGMYTEHISFSMTLNKEKVLLAITTLFQKHDKLMDLFDIPRMQSNIRLK